MYTCTICGYDKLEEPLWDEVEGFPTHFICNCCGFESGFHNDNLEMTIEQYRGEWISEGAKWFSSCVKKPENWDFKEQLKNIGIYLD